VKGEKLKKIRKGGGSAALSSRGLLAWGSSAGLVVACACFWGAGDDA
jgi:hypothetical protein